jgi:hypothetical protein
MYEETHWQAWAQRERSRTDALRPARTSTEQRQVNADPETVEAIARGVTELRRRNTGLCDDLLAHYGLGHRGPAMVVRSTRGPGRRTSDPRVELAKRWVEEWSRKHAH